MIGFWISAGALVTLVALLLAQLGRQAQSEAAVKDGSAELLVYRDQLAEVGRDQSRGTLAPADAERICFEVGRRMLDADRAHRGDALLTPARSIWFFAGATVVCLGAGAAIYADLGVPGYPDLPLSTRIELANEAYENRPSQDQAEASQPPFVQPTEIDPELAAMIDKLRVAVAMRPDDLLGHSLLVESEAALGNFVAARKSQEAVVRLRGAGVAPEDLSALAHLMVGAAGGIVTPEAEKVLVQCLQMDPRNGWARYYSGLMFAEIGRPDRAFSLWEPLLREGPDDAGWIRPIRSLIEDVAVAAGINFSLTVAGQDAAAVAAGGAP